MAVQCDFDLLADCFVLEALLAVIDLSNRLCIAPESLPCMCICRSRSEHSKDLPRSKGHFQQASSSVMLYPRLGCCLLALQSCAVDPGLENAYQ